MAGIWCLVDGKSPSDAFFVDVDASANIGPLKKLIKKENSDFKDIDAHKLILWRVKVPAEGQITLSLSNEESILSPLNLNEGQKDAIAACRLNELIPLSRLDLNEKQRATIDRCWLKEGLKGDNDPVDVMVIDSPRATILSVYPEGQGPDDYVIVQLPPSGNACSMQAFSIHLIQVPFLFP